MGKKEQCCFGQLVQTLFDLGICNVSVLLWVIERKLKSGLVPELVFWINCIWQHQITNSERKCRRPNIRCFRVGKHRLEADAEAANLVSLIVLGTFTDVGYPQNITFAECAPIVLLCEAI